MKKIAKIFLISVVSIFFAACSAFTQEISNPEGNIPEGVTQAEVQKAIRTALTERGWIVKSDKKGLIKADITVRGHKASIEIPYNKEKFAIKYVDSTNLKAEGGKIHNKYNHWVNNIYEDIRLNLSKYI